MYCDDLGFLYMGCIVRVTPKLAAVADKFAANAAGKFEMPMEGLQVSSLGGRTTRRMTPRDDG